MRIVIWALFIFAQFWVFSQDLALQISQDELHKIINASINKVLGSQKNYELNFKEITFPVGNIHIENPEKAAKNNFMKAYGEAFLAIDFPAPFGLDIKLTGIKADFQKPVLKINIKGSSQNKIMIDGSITFPSLDLQVKNSEVTDNGLTRENTRKQQLLQEKLETLTTASAKELSPNIKRQIFETKALLTCLKENQRDYKPQISFKGADHLVSLKDFKISFHSQLSMISKGENLITEIKSLSINHNLMTNTIGEHFILGLEPQQFSPQPIIAVTYELTSEKKLQINCHKLEGSDYGISHKLIGGIILPKIQDVLSEKIPQLMTEKLFPLIKGKALALNLPIKTIIDIPAQLFSISKKPFKIDSEITLNAPQMSREYGLRVSADTEVFISDNLMTHEIRALEPKTSSSPYHLTLNSSLIGSLIHYFDDVLLSHSIKTNDKLKYLRDTDEEPILTLQNHDIALHPVRENELDLAVVFNLEKHKLKKLLSFLLIDKYDFYKGFEKLNSFTCNIIEYLPYPFPFLFPHCLTEQWFHDYIEKNQIKNLEFAIDIKINTLGDKIKISLPKAKELFSSKYAKTNWKSSPILRLIYNLANEKKIIIPMPDFLGGDIELKRPGFYKYLLQQKIFAKKNLVFTSTGVPELTLEIPDVSALNLGGVSLSKEGHLSIDFSLKNYDLLLGKLPNLSNLLPKIEQIGERK